MQKQQCISSMIDNKLIEPHFQGLVNLYIEDFFAFESLIRTHPSVERIFPDQLFVMAEDQGCLLELDYFCVVSAIESFNKQKLSGLLFVNVLPITLGKVISSFTQGSVSTALQGVVFEISEKHPLHNLEELKEYIGVLRKHGALIAIDDLGAGHSGLISWAEIKPDFVKIDRHFIEGIHIDGVKREFVRSITEIARGLRCQVIAEGIEALEELEMLHHIGINLGQGYLLHCPELEPPHHYNSRQYFPLVSKVQHISHMRHAETAESLVEYVSPITPSYSAAEVNDLFKGDPDLRCLPIVDGDEPVGIVSRSKILEVFSNRYSYPLHGKKPILKVMDEGFIIVGHQEGLHDISTKITHDESANLNNDFIITKEGRYCGVGKVSTLLKFLTETQIQRARNSNPLTLLPGNLPIYDHIEYLIIQRQEFHLAYFDINHFKPFNDHFGYSAGDEVIKRLSTILVEHTTPLSDMVGHIGGDDFVVIFRTGDWQKKCEMILESFKEFALGFYSSKEIVQNGLWCKDRSGEQRFFPILSLAIGVVHPENSRNMTHHEVSELAADAKRQAKLQTGNSLFISGRRSHIKYSELPLH